MKDADCASLDCYIPEGWNFGACTGPCENDQECQARNGQDWFGCGLTQGSKRCISSCGQPGVSCSGHLPALCSEVGDDHCADCGCAKGQVCWAGVGCSRWRSLAKPVATRPTARARTAANRRAFAGWHSASRAPIMTATNAVDWARRHTAAVPVTSRQIAATYTAVDRRAAFSMLPVLQRE